MHKLPFGGFTNKLYKKYLTKICTYIFGYAFEYEKDTGVDNASKGAPPTFDDPTGFMAALLNDKNEVNRKKWHCG